MTSSIQKFVAEAIGTFALVFIGAGAVIVESHTGPSHLDVTDGKVGLLGIALAHGAILTAMIYAVGSISGGHFNPAVSFACWLQRRLDANLLAGYIVAQLAAAIAAGLCLALIFPDEVALAALGTPSLAARVTPMRGMLLEALITFILVTTILLGTRKKGGAGALAGVAIGATLVALILFAGPLTGAGANPARYLGPALVSGHLSELMIYVAGPFAGACASALLTGVVLREPVVEELAEDASDEVEVIDDEPEVKATPASLLPRLWPRRPSPVASPRRTRSAPDQGPPEVRMRRAYELFEAGQLQAAATLVRPLLGEQEFSQRARAFLIVIEGELA